MTYLTIYILASANGFYGLVLWIMVIGGGLLIDSILAAERNPTTVVDDDKEEMDRYASFVLPEEETLK